MYSSILISDGGKRKELFFRCLKSIERNPPPGKFEVVIGTDQLSDEYHKELEELTHSVSYPITIVFIDNELFERYTGYKHYFNNASITNNAAFVHRRYNSENVFLMGNEIIAYKNCFEEMIKAKPNNRSLVLSTTYDVPEAIVARLNKDGSNIDSLIGHCTDYPLASRSYHSDVTNYISCCSPQLWKDIGGYDERYVAGIAAEDSDFVQRCRALPDFQIVRCGSEAISLHQFHGGKTCYYDPKEEVIARARWDEGVERNRNLYHSWDGKAMNSMYWKMGEFGLHGITSMRY